MKRIKHSLIYFSLVALLTQGCDTGSRIMTTQLMTKNPVQYQKTEWNVVLKAKWEDPYRCDQIALDMIVTQPSGKKQIIPCFFYSGNSNEKSEWRARYAPSEKGEYEYRFLLTENGKNVSETRSKKFMAEGSDSKGFLHVNDRWTLRFDNGDVFRGIGQNICWESRSNDDSKFFKSLHEDQRFNYDYMLTKLARNGGNFFRTWMIYWNLPVDWRTVSNNDRYTNSTARYNESGIKRMDHLVELCDSLGIYFMLALESHVGYMDYGWEISNYNSKNGGFASTPAEFFTLDQSKEQYKCKLRYMIARWGYSPSIAALEFFNEIDNAMYHGDSSDFISAETITAWHDEMSTYLKSVDPYGHIITTSVSHRDVKGLNELKNMDINQRHIYKFTDGIPEIISENIRKSNKPCVIGEFGYEWDWSKNFNDFADEMDNDFRKGLWYGLFSPTPILPMSWWWEFFENRGMMEYFTHVQKVNDEMMRSANGSFKKAELPEIKDIHVLGVECGNRTFVYCHNPLSRNFSLDLNQWFESLLYKNILYYDFNESNFIPVAESQAGKNVMTLSPESNLIIIFEK